MWARFKNLKSKYEKLHCNLQENLPCCFLAISVLMIIVLILRNIAITHPICVTDEWYYSLSSRKMIEMQPETPCYLYYLVYSLTNLCGDGFLEAAKLLNVLLFSTANMFIYLITKKVASKNYAIMVVLLSLVWPFNIYTLFFMPESMYFFVFWVLIWFLVSFDNSNNSMLVVACIAGILLGILALVKPHALFLVPVFIVYILLRNKYINDTFVSFNKRLQCIAVIIGSALSLKFLFAYYFVGSKGITLFGGYSTYANSTISLIFAHFREFYRLYCVNSIGHFLCILIIYNVPLFIALLILQNNNKKLVKDNEIYKIAFLFVASLVILVAVVVCFQVKMYFVRPSSESVYRVHLRYYNFLYPFALILSAACANKVFSVGNKWSTAIFVLIIILSASLVFRNSDVYLPSLVDCPEMYAVLGGDMKYYLCFSIVLMLLCLKSSHTASKIYIGIYLLIFLFCFHYKYFTEMPFKYMDDYIKSGYYAKQTFTPRILKNTVVLGKDAGHLFHTLFQMDEPRATCQVMSHDMVDLSRFSDKSLCIIIGKHNIQNQNDFFCYYKTRGYAVYARKDKILKFSSGNFDASLLETVGLSQPETTGSWSDANIAPFVELLFPLDLPNTFVLHLKATAFAPNVGKNLIIKFGNSSYKYMISEETIDLSFKVDLGGEKVTTMQIIPPRPESPQAIGLNQDTRKLGIFLKEISIE